MPGDWRRTVTPPGGKERIPVEMGTGPKDYDKLNMSGTQNVKTVSSKKKK